MLSGACGIFVETCPHYGIYIRGNPFRALIEFYFFLLRKRISGNKVAKNRKIAQKRESTSLSPLEWALEMKHNLV